MVTYDVISKQIYEYLQVGLNYLVLLQLVESVSTYRVDVLKYHRRSSVAALPE